MHDRAPRAEWHHLDDETALGLLLLCGLTTAAVVLLVRAYPVQLAAAAPLILALAWGTSRARAAMRDRRAARDDPPPPGVIVGHVRGSWRGARPRPFRIPWDAFRQHVLIAGPTGRGKTFTFVEPFLRAHLSRPRTGVLYLDGKGDPIHETSPGGLAFDHVFYPERPGRSAHWNPLAGPDPIVAANLFAAALFPEAATPELTGSFYAARAVYAITRVAPAIAFTGYDTDNASRPRAAVDESALVAGLVELGVAADVAVKLARRHPERVADQLVWVEFRGESDRSAERLVEAIERNWSAPPGVQPLQIYDVSPLQLARTMFAPDGLAPLIEAVAQITAGCPDARQRDTIIQLRSDLEGLERLPDRERATVFQSLQNRLGFFAEPPFDKLCARSDFSLADVAAGTRVAFLLPTGRFPNTAKPLGRVALSQFKNAVLASSAEREKIAVLDEFHNFVSGDFAGFLNQARSRGGGAVIATQSLGDFPRDQAEAMLANISTVIVTPGCRPADAQYFADAFGKTPQARHAVSYEAPSPLQPRPRPTVRTHLIEDYRHTPTEIAELDAGLALIQVTAGRRSWPVTRVHVERSRG